MVSIIPEKVEKSRFDPVFGPDVSSWVALDKAAPMKHTLNNYE
jgi:hypothetical protein